jgi:Fungalysin metallopeptidase (M36)
MLLGDSVTPWAMELSLFGVTFSDGDHGFRAIDAGDDASIVDHEYTHGFTNQTVTFSDGSPALFSPQAWAIDEASADFFAKSYLVDNRFETDTAAPGEVDMGDYTDVTRDSIRAEPLDCPVGTQSAACPGHGYTYADFGAVSGFGPEPHYDGEIWSETMWDLRGAVGAQRATQLAAQALAIVAPEPSFLDLRDATLTADAADHFDDATAIWQVFARRGMGCDASTTSGFDVAPHAGFNVPPCPVAAPAPQAIATPVPIATPVAPPRQPSVLLKASGRRALAFTVTCHALCNVTGTLRVDGRTARRLKLGKRRIVGRVTARLAAPGTKTFTVRLNRAAAKALKRERKLKSFKATLIVQAAYPGAAVAFKHRTVTVRR